MIDAFVAPHVRAVLATRGGKGSYRIAHRLPFETIAANPKPVVGFSDITILHMMLWKKCALEGVHGALTSDAEDRLSETAAASLHAVLMKDGSAEIAAQTATASYELTTFGTARGPLLGGNLDMLCTAAGWALPPFRGAVLLVESAGLGIGQLDRALTMLVRGKHLESIAGIAVGHINGTPSNPPWSAIDLIRQHLGPLEVPILGGLPIGHDMDARSVPIGRTVILDADGLKLHIQG
ncbi:MAG TPA: LD-carboxypeptidase [Aurantimonas coralicida]|uniref:LD-carboxypeptidase n=1 Tax=Aurantimonas coralicida TaxID=182270 RepID=A0A9C9TIJ7_9HYPH|nr:LD-carboxypeptidase [Aurantimonas coralicida]HEU01831.1 LD-carboxypeptidase [Aurantimonas coralicida]